MPPPTTLANARDLGGTPLAGGSAVRSGVLLRSDAPHQDDAGPPPVPVWPPRTVIDLRSTEEAGGRHPLDGPGTTVHAVPLSRRMRLGDMAAYGDLLAGGLEGLYRTTLLSGGPTMAEVVGLIADAADGPVLVHCAAGKDRTGLVIAVVLGAIGAEREAIVADYVATDPQMGEVLGRLTAGERPGVGALLALLEEHPESLRAPASAIEAALDIVDHAGGAAAWLRAQGLGDEALGRLRDRLSEHRLRAPE